MSDTNDSPETDETVRLRTRIEELEAELSRRIKEQQAASREELAASTRDTINRALDENRKLLRGLTLAYLEQLRLVGDLVGSFADEVFERNQSSGREDSIVDLAGNLPGDLYAAFVNSINRSLDIPGKTIDKFCESFKETE